MDFFRAELLGQHVQEFWGDVGMTIIHHTGKDGLEYRGSSVIKGAVDALIVAKAEDLEITVTSKGYKDAADFETFTVRCESVEVETEDGPEQVLAVKERVDFQASAKPTKEEEDLATMSRVLICLGNKATYTRWFEEVHRWTTPKGESKDGKAKEGWSETTFRRKLSKLKELGHVIGGENQGDCYSVVLDEARRSRAVQPGEGLGGEGERAGSEESTVTNNRPATPFQGGGGGGGSFLDRHEPPNHRHGGSGGGSRNDGNASKPVVPNDQNDVLATIGAAMQQVKKAEGER